MLTSEILEVIFDILTEPQPQEPSSPRAEYRGSLGTTSSSAPAQFEPASSNQPSIHSDIDSYFDHTVWLLKNEKVAFQNDNKAQNLI